MGRIVALCLLSLGLAALPSAAGDLLLVLAKSGATVHALDADSGETLFSLPTGAGPHELAVSPDGSRAVVADYGAAGPDGYRAGTTLSVIDLVAREVSATLTLDSHTSPHGIQFLPDGRHLAVTAERSAAVLLVDVIEGAIERVLPTGAGGSHMLVVSPDGHRVYTANMGSGSVSVIDLGSGELLAEIPTGAECEGIDITPDGKQVWASNRQAGTLSVIDTETLRVLAELDAPGFPIRVKLTPDGSRALVSCATASTVLVFDVKTRELLASLPISADIADDAGTRLFGASLQDSPTPIGIVVHPNGSRAWVAAANADALVEIDLATLKVTRALPAGPEPDGLAFARMPRD